MAATSLVDALVKTAQQYAQLIAGVLWRAERFRAQETNESAPAGAVNLQELARDLEHAIADECATLQVQQIDKERLALLIRHAWLSTADPTSNQRPDVLALVCQALASPLRPSSYEVARFSVVLALRTLYDVRHSTEGIAKLTAAYEAIHDRMRGQSHHKPHRHQAKHYEGFLIDLFALDSHVFRSIPREEREAFYKDFRIFPFGVDATKGCRTGDSPNWCEPQGELPDLSAIVNLAFCQPLGIAGLDEVTGGLLPAADDGETRGGLVTLVTGEPGSGKTTLCLTIASRMAEMGSTVQYLATEEAVGSLRAKLATAPRLSRSWPEIAVEPPEEALGFDILPCSNYPSLSTFVGRLDAEITKADVPAVNSLDGTDNQEEATVTLVPTFPRVLVIDSITALLSPREGEATAEYPDRRSALAQSLQLLRNHGVCVFLVGGPEDGKDNGLAYLVDNVLALDRVVAGSRHTVRLITLTKTRLQASLRDQHVFHLGRQDGFSVSPSLHSTLQLLRGRVQTHPDKSRRGVVLAALPKVRSGPRQPKKSKRDTVASDFIAIRAQSQCLVYGRGSAAKARFAISIAFEPKYPAHDLDIWRPHVWKRQQRSPERDLDETNWLEESRVLIITFLYDRQYYHEVVIQYFQSRFALEMSGKSSEEFLRRHLDVLDFYPSLIDPETLVAHVRRQLTAARLSGRPFTGVVIDGIHNILLQFPLLEGEHLLWPALYKLFRTEGVETVSTFTFFDYNSIAPDANPMRDPVGGSERLFFHLLVSGCDYSFQVQRPVKPSGPTANLVSARLVATLDGVQGDPRDFRWDPETFQTIELAD